jgi:hypothetical protein
MMMMMTVVNIYTSTKGMLLSSGERSYFVFKVSLDSMTEDFMVFLGSLYYMLRYYIKLDED